MDPWWVIKNLKDVVVRGKEKKHTHTHTKATNEKSKKNAETI